MLTTERTTDSRESERLGEEHEKDKKSPEPRKEGEDTVAVGVMKAIRECAVVGRVACSIANSLDLNGTSFGAQRP